ncbi:hypothetical protein T8K17_20590 [Thalassobaculum sp. OXR-137]|uniref:hypothetical protein n=1 Tax=Thalassobaculum sp. OXR-137 TaxID=3100173 RepID=UPI002AC9A10E|nr:hypothetical protein [Thalassobaculum sp. OXR-137]WPZ33621.1 hypothetical protein T8K17_20590 [Thalassobaculum sp. OXR-137]
MKTTVAEHNASFLETISTQLLDLVARVEDDVARYADAKVGPAGGGFVIYYLTDENGEPLKDVTAADLGTSLSDIVATKGFQQLQDHCEMRDLKVRIDEHFYATDPRPTKIYRVIVDGWQIGSLT